MICYRFLRLKDHHCYDIILAKLDYFEKAVHELGGNLSTCEKQNCNPRQVKKKY